jgi:hypothetical protein
MWTHFVNLFFRTWTDLLSALGTTTLAVVLFSVLVPAVIWLGTVIAKWRSGKDSVPPMTLGNAFRHSAPSAFGTAGITLIVWALVFGCFGVRAVYNDHQVLVAKANAPKLPCPECPSCSTCPPSKVITRTAEEPHKCWMTNHFEFPGPRKEQVLTATTVIIHCNYKVEAPFVVKLAFAEDNFIGADTAMLPDEGVVTGGGGYKQGKLSIAKVQSPSLPAQELVTILALGTTDQPPRAIDYRIESK